MGNFYAIADPQKTSVTSPDYTADQLIAMSRSLRKIINEQYKFIHPLDVNIQGAAM